MTTPEKEQKMHEEFEKWINTSEGYGLAFARECWNTAWKASRAALEQESEVWRCSFTPPEQVTISMQNARLIGNELIHKPLESDKEMVECVEQAIMKYRSCGPKMQAKAAIAAINMGDAGQPGLETGTPEHRLEGATVNNPSPANICPHVITSDEGTSYCNLAENQGRPVTVSLEKCAKALADEFGDIVGNPQRQAARAILESLKQQGVPLNVED